MNTISATDPIGSHTLQVISKADRFNRWMYDEFRQHLKGRILEIGSGIGNVSDHLIEDGLDVTLSDNNHEYVDWLRKKYQNKKVNRILELDLLEPDFHNLYNGLHQQFDTIFLLNVIEHVEDDALAIKNCKYLLRTGGNLIVLAPAHRWLFCKFDKELGHYRRYTGKQLSRLFELHNIKILKKKWFNLTGIAGWMILGKLFNKKVIGKGEMFALNKIVPIARIIDKITMNRLGLSIIVIGTKEK